MRNIAPGLAFTIALGSAAVALTLIASTASAQIRQLPETSRSEAQVNTLNNSMMQQQRERAVSQQNRFETNSLQTQIHSQPVAPPVIAPPVVPRPRVGR